MEWIIWNECLCHKVNLCLIIQSYRKKPPSVTKSVSSSVSQRTWDFKFSLKGKWVYVAAGYDIQMSCLIIILLLCGVIVQSVKETQISICPTDKQWSLFVWSRRKRNQAYQCVKPPLRSSPPWLSVIFLFNANNFKAYDSASSLYHSGGAIMYSFLLFLQWKVNDI